MFEPVRGGTRGGQAEFKWSDVSADKDREHYLGHSINAPTGRWQKNKDVHWYGRDAKDTASEREEELKEIKRLEAAALAAALGYEPAAKDGDASGSNAIALPNRESPEDAAARLKEKEERRQRKEEKRQRKEEKRARKELKRNGETDDRDGRRRSSRSRSPRRRHESNTLRPRSPSPRESDRRRDRQPPSRTEYGEEEREHERMRERRQWDLNAKRDRPRH